MNRIFLIALIWLSSSGLFAQTYGPGLYLGAGIDGNLGILNGNISKYFNNHNFPMAGQNLYLKYKRFIFFKLGMTNLNMPNTSLKEPFNYNDKIWSPDSTTRWGMMTYVSLGYSIIDTKRFTISPLIGTSWIRVSNGKSRMKFNNSYIAALEMDYKMCLEKWKTAYLVLRLKGMYAPLKNENNDDRFNGFCFYYGLELGYCSTIYAKKIKKK